MTAAKSLNFRGTRESRFLTPVLGGRPLIENVRFAFLVTRTVPELNGHEAATLVEVPGACVALEGVETHAGGTPRHRLRQQRAADAPALLAREDVELRQHVAV